MSAERNVRNNEQENDWRNNVKYLSATVPKETSREHHMIYKHFQTQFVGMFPSASRRGFDVVKGARRKEETRLERETVNQV